VLYIFKIVSVLTFLKIVLLIVPINCKNFANLNSTSLENVIESKPLNSAYCVVMLRFTKLTHIYKMLSFQKQARIRWNSWWCSFSLKMSCCGGLMHPMCCTLLLLLYSSLSLTLTPSDGVQYSRRMAISYPWSQRPDYTVGNSNTPPSLTRKRTTFHLSCAKFRLFQS